MPGVHQPSLTDQLTGLKDSLWHIAPMLILAGGLILFLILGLNFRRSADRWMGWAVLLTLGLAGGQLIIQMCSCAAGVKRLLFLWALMVDNPARVWSLMAICGTFLAVLVSLFSKKEEDHPVAETHWLLLAAGLGASLLPLANHLLIAFLCLELTALAGYALVFAGRQKIAPKAAMQYLLFGAVAAAIQLYGIAWLYGLTGELTLLFMPQLDPSLAAGVAVLLVLVGLLFKLGAVPMQGWVPSVYAGAPLPVGAFLSIVPKIGALAFLLRFVKATPHAFPAAWGVDWELVLLLAGIVSVLLGTFAALRQQTARGLLGYSTVAQAGFLLLALSVSLTQGPTVIWFYLIAYAVATYCVFLGVELLESGADAIRLGGFAGLGPKNFHLGVLLTLGLVALAGLPPTGIFTGKLLLFTGLWERYTVVDNSLIVWVLLLGILSAVAGLFYYFRLPVQLFLRSESQENALEVNLLAKILFLVLGAGVVGLFLFPGLLLDQLSSLIGR